MDHVLMQNISLNEQNCNYKLSREQLDGGGSPTLVKVRERWWFHIESNKQVSEVLY